MLTQSRKRALLSQAPPAVQDAVEKQTLLSLPDVPLVLVLSHLSVKDLVAAGQAHPRLAELTRAHASLWRGKETSDEYYFANVVGLFELLRVVPPVYNLKFVVRQHSPMVSARLEKFTRPSQPTAFTTLVVEGPNTECCIAVIRETHAELEHLSIIGIEYGLEQTLRSLQVASKLRTLSMCLEYYFVRCNFKWPQTLVLPKLRSVAFRCRGEYFDGVRQRGPDSTVLEALGSLLLAHREQLHYLRLDSSQVLPLLNHCTAKLNWLCVNVTEDKVVTTPDLKQRLRGLKYLVIGLSHKEAQANALLEACTGGLLEHLEIANCREGTLRSLGAFGLTSLKRLSLHRDSDHSPWGIGSLEAALAGMSPLHSLYITKLCSSVRPPQLLSRLSAATIPELSFIFFADRFIRGFCTNSVSTTHFSGHRHCRDLVRRAPKPLHVVAKLKRFVNRKAKYYCVVFFKHSVAGADVSSCPLCAEAETAVSQYCGEQYKINDRVQVE